ncbi:hypothetical protein I8D64_07935 [Brachybacterium sp. MASK1Z-5]|uniref:Uncharacterized protein n=1 Tax=Brachybacterium halotolerans TaxID=2795215 RepID=A0ABS1BBG1_9MICO|nr:hypothetical protein [Brachybacterium halotolerans]MBK0331330.1 hypothetical protein [Brachybacterium halotolerans]
MTTRRLLRSMTPALGAALLVPALLAAPASASPPAQAETQPFGGNVRYAWEIPDAPASGMTSLTMPMTIHEDSDYIDGSYVAVQYAFTGQDQVGYMGLQPRPDSTTGKTRLHGVFSSFIPGTTSTDSNCTDGADGGAGVSCANDFTAVAGRTYDIEVKKAGKNTWTGTAIDTVKGKRFHIGTYTVPAGSGKLVNKQTGFVENYWNHSRTCEGIQRIDTTVGRPRTGNLQGRADSPEEYGDCLDQANYSATVKNGQLRISRGWL